MATWKPSYLWQGLPGHPIHPPFTDLRSVQTLVDGDHLSIRYAAQDISEHDGRGYYTFESISTNQRGEQVCRGTWTNIVRGV